MNLDHRSRLDIQMAACGTACDRCLLSQHEDTFTPVSAETHAQDLVAILTDMPSNKDVDHGRPLSDGAGKELQDALDEFGFPRNRCRIIPVVACRPIGGDLEGVLRSTSRLNKSATAKQAADDLAHDPPWRTPMAACRPRLLGDITGFKYALAMGTIAMDALRSGGRSLDTMRGTVETLPAPWAQAFADVGLPRENMPTIKVGYTYHPGRVAHDPLLRPVFRHDIAKTFRFFRNKLQWTDPQILICENYRQVQDGFDRLRKDTLFGEKIVAFDVETEGKYALYSRLRCISFANRYFSMVVPFLSIDGKTRPMPIADLKASAKLVRDHLANPPWKLIGHNAGVYDRLSCETWFGVTPKLAEDTILLDLLASNDGLPHRLAFLGSYRTDMPEAWKADNPADEARTDEELWVYNAKDSCVTVHIRQPIMAEVERRWQTHLIEREQMLQSMGVGMQRIGMKVDTKRVRGLISDTQKEADGFLKIAHEIGGKGFNPNSGLQVGNLLFKTWKLLPVAYSEKTGEPSTDDNTLRTMLIEYGLKGDQLALVKAIRMYRKKIKRMGALYPLSTRVGEKYTKGYNDGEGEGMIGKDGRLHPSYNRLPASGRFSSSDPNAQNIEELIRSCFIPEDGHVFIGCDADQLEARYIAEEAKAMRMVKVFNDLLDLHNETMELVYGPGVWTMGGAPKGTRLGKGDKESDFFNTRAVTKNTRYAWQYAAEVESIWLQVTSAEDKTGKLLFPHLTKDDIRLVRDGLNSADPEIPAWWKQIKRDLRRNGFISDSLWGRRREFKGDTTLNEWVNHPIQSGGFHMVAEALLELLHGTLPWFATEAAAPFEFDLTQFQWDFEEKTGLVTQTHDSSLWEVPEDHADEHKKLLQAAMTRRRKEGALLTYTAEAKKGHTWMEV